MRVPGVLVVVVVVAVIAIRFWKDRPEPRPWTLAEPAPKSTMSIRIRVDSGQCNTSPEVERIEVEETEQAVKIKPYVDPFGSPLALPEGMDDCLEAIDAVVKLDQPLDDRQLLGDLNGGALGRGVR